jgi:CheY-like chemotaxis protein
MSNECSTATPLPFDKKAELGSDTILVIEDEEIVRTTVEKILVSLGYKAVLTNDGLEGVAQFSQAPNRFNLVLLDLAMPRLDGVQTITEIRRINPDIPVLLMTGYSENEAMERFKGKGLTGFIQKPFDIPTLRQKLKNTLA